MSSALRQPTANHGFDGIKLKFGLSACHDWEKFCANGGGPIVVGAVQGASCFGPAYEFFTQCFLYIVSKWQSACACANNNNMCHIISLTII
jgi:hypothetical protein